MSRKSSAVSHRNKHGIAEVRSTPRRTRSSRAHSHAQSRRAKPAVTSRVLQGVARSMAPFYKRIVENESFAQAFSRAVVKADLNAMQKLFHRASPHAREAFPGSNGIGYFFNYPFVKPTLQYANGTTIPPGSVQFKFETRAHRAVARAVFPLYRAIADSRPFALALAKAIRTRDSVAAVHLVRTLVPARTLQSVAIEEGGLALNFSFSFSTYIYRNLLFLDQDA